MLWLFKIWRRCKQGVQENCYFIIFMPHPQAGHQKAPWIGGGRLGKHHNFSGTPCYFMLLYTHTHTHNIHIHWFDCYLTFANIISNNKNMRFSSCHSYTKIWRIGYENMISVGIFGPKQTPQITLSIRPRWVIYPSLSEHDNTCSEEVKAHRELSVISDGQTNKK